MTEHPASLTMRPDLLSDALRAVRLTGALYYRVSTTTPWPAIRAPLGVELAPAFARRTRNVALYHVVIEGSCWAAAEECDPVQLGKGDIVAFPTGVPYFLACALPPGKAPAEAGSLVDLLRAVASGAVPPSFTFGEGAGQTTFVCGFLGCDPLPFDPLFASLPPMLVAREVKGQLATLIELALAGVDGAGSMSVRERLSESMFLETLRQHLISGQAAAWTCGTNDSVAAHALALLHDDPDTRGPWPPWRPRSGHPALRWQSASPRPSARRRCSTSRAVVSSSRPRSSTTEPRSPPSHTGSATAPRRHSAGHSSGRPASLRQHGAARIALPELDPTSTAGHAEFGAYAECALPTMRPHTRH